MAFNICRKFSNIMRITTVDKSREGRTLILIVLFCQLSPLIWCIFVYLMDYSETEGFQPEFSENISIFGLFTDGN